MNRAVTIGGAVLGAAVLMGAGVAVGTKVGQEQAAATVAADAAAQAPKGFAVPEEQMRLTAFAQSAAEFQKLINKATKDGASPEIAEQMTTYAVGVRAVKRTAETEELRDAADSLSEAMLLISAGVLTDEGGITQEGIDAYKAADEKVSALAETVAQQQGLSVPTEEPEPAPSE